MRAKNRPDIGRFNVFLREHCGWEVELGVTPDNSSDFLRVYRLQENVKKSRRRVFMGSLPVETELGCLASCGALCKHYYELGLKHGGAGVDPRDNPHFHG